VSTTDTKTVTYSGPHRSVLVAGHPDPIKAGEPTAVPAELAESLTGQPGWETGDAPPPAPEPDPAPQPDDVDDPVDPPATPSRRR
jgi:hypothetical protein